MYLNEEHWIVDWQDDIEIKTRSSEPIWISIDELYKMVEAIKYAKHEKSQEELKNINSR